jgi:hypothetical protein
MGFSGIPKRDTAVTGLLVEFPVKENRLSYNFMSQSVPRVTLRAVLGAGFAKERPDGFGA